MPQNEPVTLCDIVTMREFQFDWILFPNLNGLFQEQNDLSRFNCVSNRYGVYFFFDNSRNVEYIGCIESRPIRDRIRQYFSCNWDSGNKFGEYWIELNYQDPDINIPYRGHYKPYIENLQLGTLSHESTEVIDMSNDMEKYLICKLQPPYNRNHYLTYTPEMTDCEQNELYSSLLEDVSGENIHLRPCLVPNTDG